MISKIIFLILAIFLAILQTTVFPVNLLLVSIVILAFVWQDEIPPFAFFSGLLFDLIRGAPLGISSALFLITAGCTIFVKKAFFFRHRDHLIITSRK
ncbi:hypothetical protein FJZ40_00870 [Candidatus Shapirobacteria bacterium]|nr:hypothetical protein [Candidatus Shapirobacteria bacterium]